MKKRIFLLPLLFLAIISVSGCTEGYDPHKYANNGTYYNPELNLKFNYPSDWKIIEATPYEILSISKDDTQDNIITFILTKNDKNYTTIDALIDANIGLYENDKSYEIKENEKIKVGNKEWGIVKMKRNKLITDVFTNCPNYTFSMTYFTSTNSTFNFFPIMESLECGEVNKP